MTKLTDLSRRQIRYLCYRLQTEAEGGNKATPEDSGVMSNISLVKEHMEDQDDFGGWSKFAKTWDVDQRSPLVTVRRNSSIHTEWNRTLSKLAKALPEIEPKKLLTNQLSEKVQAKKSQQTKKRPSIG